MKTFDIAADLEPGTTLLEASAGTGKTWTIAALVAKHIASGDVRLDEMLVVTFTRAAKAHRPIASRPGWRVMTLVCEAFDSGGDKVLEFESAVLVKTG